MPRSKSHEEHLPETVRPAIFAVGGLPSPLNMLLIHIVGDILRRIHGAVVTCPLNVRDQCDLDAAINAGQAILVFFDVPDAEVVEFIRDGSFPRLLVEEPFDVAVTYSMAARQIGFIEACRFVSHSMCSLEPLIQQSDVAKIAVQYDVLLASWIDLIAEKIDISADAWMSVRTLMHQDYAHLKTIQDAVFALIYLAEEGAARAKNLTRETRQILDAFNQSYRFGVIDEVFWPAEILLNATPPYEPVSGELSIVGPSRVLTFGPYMHLPAGEWTADYAFETLDNGSGNLYCFDVVTDGAIQFSTQGLINSSGKFLISCDFEVTEPASPVEFRCFIAEGAIGGRLTPLGVTVRRRAEDKSSQAAFRI